MKTQCSQEKIKNNKKKEKNFDKNKFNDKINNPYTVIEFKEENGFAIPKVLMLSSDSHLYREGLPLKYNDEIYF